MNKESRIFVAGSTGLIGSAVMRYLQNNRFTHLLLPRHCELELTDSAAVDNFFQTYRPEYVILAAGKVGGIIENQTYPADFLTHNLAIQLNVLKAAHQHQIRKLILFGSSCMYPRECTQPMKEADLLSGQPESTSLAYAMAKLTGVQLCLAYNQQYGQQRFIPVIPNSAFGPHDNFDLSSGHVLAVLIRRFHEARQNNVKNVTLWGSGTPRREFIHADDIAAACVALLSGNINTLTMPLNLGTGQDFSICELTHMIARITGYRGTIEWDISKPDGAPAKLLDSSRLRAFGWQPHIDFETGLRETYQWYLNNIVQVGYA